VTAQHELTASGGFIFKTAEIVASIYGKKKFSVTAQKKYAKGQKI
jgi:hypothetical protein